MSETPQAPRPAAWPILAAAVSWTLTAVMVSNLLAGTFDTRSCQTVCVQILAASAVIAAVLGLALGHKAPRHWATVVAVLALAALLVMYAVTFFIGTVFG